MADPRHATRVNSHTGVSRALNSTLLCSCNALKMALSASCISHKGEEANSDRGAPLSLAFALLSISFYIHCNSPHFCVHLDQADCTVLLCTSVSQPSFLWNQQSNPCLCHGLPATTASAMASQLLLLALLSLATSEPFHLPCIRSFPRLFFPPDVKSEQNSFV